MEIFHFEAKESHPELLYTAEEKEKGLIND